MWEVYKCGVKECRAWGGEEQDAGGQGGGEGLGGDSRAPAEGGERCDSGGGKGAIFFPFVFDKWLVG